MKQEGFAVILFIIGVLVISSSVIGGSIYYKNIVRSISSIQTKNSGHLTLSPTPSLLLAKVQGRSMLPTYQDGDSWEYEEYSSQSPKTGDVVYMQYPNNSDVKGIKRVIGIPGDRVKIEKGQLFLNGQLYNNQNFVPNSSSITAGQFLKGGLEFLVPADHYFIMGDSHELSMDSREFGSVGKQLIIGKLTELYQKGGVETAVVKKQFSIENIDESAITLEQGILSGPNKPYKYSKYVVSGDFNLPVEGKYQITAIMDQTINLGVSFDGKNYNPQIYNLPAGKQKIYLLFDDSGCPSSGLEKQVLGTNEVHSMEIKVTLTNFAFSPNNSTQRIDYFAVFQVKPHKKSDFYQHCKGYSDV